MKNYARTILSIHAHPDDEASKGASLIAKYKSLGARAVLITATGGEEGDILNKALDTPYVRDNLVEVRRNELMAATQIIGYDRVEMLGYRDSGMVGTDANANPSCFAMAPSDEVVRKIVRIIRDEKPSVMLTYPEVQSRYPHPDHVRVYEVSIRAFELSSDPAYAPELGDVHMIDKVYFHIWSRERMIALHKKFIELGLESPFSPDWLTSVDQDYIATTKISMDGFSSVARDALRAHATQIDPSAPGWFGLSVDEAEAAYPTEDLFLAVSPNNYAFDGIEDDLFGGLD